MKHVMLKNSLACIFIISVLMTAAGCKKEPVFSHAPKVPKIGFLMDSLIEERWGRDKDIFLSHANRLGADVIVQFSEGNTERQEKQLYYLLDQGVDVLVIIASDPSALAPAIHEADRRGVPSLLYERLVFNSGADLYLAYDGLSVGMQQAKGMMEKLGTGSIVIYNGLHGDVYAEEVHEGIMNTLDGAVDDGSIKIIADHWPETINNEEAFNYMSSLLENNDRVDGVIAINDLQAEAIIRALAINRMAGKTIVIGADADLAACQRIAEGTQYMTIYKPIEYIASTAAELAVYMAKKDRFTIHNAINDGTFRIPYYKLHPIAVDTSNIHETVIKDGFHLKEDVYRNVLR